MEGKKLNELKEFLRKAKKATFASGSPAKKVEKNGRRYKYEEGNFLYIDTYRGSIIDIGEELVFFKGKLIWGMCYRGGLIKRADLSKICFSFLKKCLQKIPKQFPIRGPIFFEEQDFRYEHNWVGNISDFVGEEKIFYQGEQIYFRNYLGGLIK